MDAQTYAAVRGAMAEAHEAVMALGAVGPPVLWAARSGRLVGYVSLRPVHVGEDAFQGVSELGMLAAGAEADEVMMAWESQDLAVATGAEPDFDGTCLCVLWADATGYKLQRLPYRELDIGPAENGLRACRPDWLVEPAPEVAGPLPLAISSALHMCFAGWGEHANPGIEGVRGYLESCGYSVRLLAYREDAAAGS